MFAVDGGKVLWGLRIVFEVRADGLVGCGWRWDFHRGWARCNGAEVGNTDRFVLLFDRWVGATV
jgi:hypothetical protein